MLKRSTWAFLAFVVLVPVAAFAHHSFAAEWDSKKCREFTGTLSKLDGRTRTRTSSWT